MATDFTVIATQPWTYLDSTNRVVNGYRVFFKITQFDEVHEALVTSLAPEVVKAALTKIAKDRIDLSKI